MKNFPLLFSAFLFSTMMSAQTPNPTNELTHEIAVLEIHCSGVTGIFIAYPDQEPEFIDLRGFATRKALLLNTQIIQTTLQKFYQEGWKIESAINDEDGISRYILKRQRSE